VGANETIPYGQAAVPARTLRVDVVAGPDAGQSLVADAESVSVGTADGNSLVLSDKTVSRYHLELVRGSTGIEVRDHGSTNGTSIGNVRIGRAFVPPGSELQIGATTLRVSDGRTVNVELFAGEQLAGLRGRSPSMRRLMAQVKKAAASDVAVLLIGESGTGKEVIAQALHELSPRQNRPFVTVDCGSLAPTLVASELFGHERGAFTGADRRHIGAFERASGGTLFLDELGELPDALQTSLLGVLERRRFRRLGGDQEIGVDVRLVAATNRDLRSEVNEGSFRLDLYYRVAVVTLAVPALRERPEDIPVLAEHFVREMGYEQPMGALFSPDALARLGRHHWPGNVRELRNLVEATLAMGETPTLSSPIGPGSERDSIGAVLKLPYKDARRQVLAEFEQRYLQRLIDDAGGNVSKAARTAKMDRSHLIDLLSRHDLRGD